MSTASRIIIAIASLCIIATYFLPFWFIHLIAPQYPEGLTMQIWPYKLTGEVQIINGLNHYIGMKKIDAEMFPELSYLVYIIGVYIVLGLVVALVGNRKLLTAYLVLCVVGGIAAMVDMYLWGYNYGHNLDPEAPIRVPGLSYQPPLIGHKKLLNFDAFSYPDTGGWVIIIAVLIMFLVWFFEWRKSHKAYHQKGNLLQPVTTVIFFMMLIPGCSSKPQKIVWGQDQCNECKMTLMDPRFGAEVVTKKGKAYKFDDAHCLASFLRSATVKEADIAHTVFIDFENKDHFIDAGSAHFVVSPQLKSPMNSNATAFASKAAAETKADETKGKLMDWPALYKAL